MKYSGERLGVSPPWKTRGMTRMADAASSAKVCEKNRQLKASVATRRADAQPLAGARGFTLIELLASFGIIALLMSLVLPAVNNARKSVRQGPSPRSRRRIAQTDRRHDEIERSCTTPCEPGLPPATRICLPSTEGARS